MIEEKAIVTALDGDLAMIQMQRQSTCSHCELSNGCGTGAIGRMLGHNSKPLTIRNDYDLRPGDKVLLGIPERAFMKANFLIYGLPLAGLIGAGLLADEIFSKSELLVFSFSIAGFIAGLIISDRIASKQLSQHFAPIILQVNAELKP